MTIKFKLAEETLLKVIPRMSEKPAGVLFLQVQI